MKLENHYQAIFHPLRDATSKRECAKGLFKSLALSVATFGILPLISFLHHREIKKKSAENLSPLDVKTQQTSQTLLPSNPEVKQRESGHSLAPNHAPIARESTTIKAGSNDNPKIKKKFDIHELSDNWKKNLRSITAAANRGDPNAKFQLLVWQIEERNIGSFDFKNEYDIIIQNAIKEKNPEALLLRIKDLYKDLNYANNTAEIKNGIDQLRNTLEGLQTPQAQDAKAKLWSLNHKEGDTDKLKNAAEKGNREAQYQLGKKNTRKYEGALFSAAEAGHPEAQYQLVSLISQNVIKLTEDKDKESVITDLLEKAAMQGHKDALGELLQKKPDQQEWGNALKELFNLALS